MSLIRRCDRCLQDIDPSEDRDMIGGIIFNCEEEETKLWRLAVIPSFAEKLFENSPPVWKNKDLCKRCIMTIIIIQWQKENPKCLINMIKNIEPFKT